ncbi:sensor histidine kinase [Paenibacillus alba]|uniref:cache domain-containing sensor histidine kinase n=1 Tax=Paenibacillus alba TaxID=1197127 RepID=UPI0015641FDF|nr:sensor histidine kinase [Paenibacillus alba]NQX71390.1 sensor histidine kinase [Paenibacillus alba]
MNSHVIGPTIRTRFSSKSLTQRIFVTFSILVLIPLMISSVYVYHNYSKNFEEESFKHMDDLVQKLSGDMDKLYSESNSSLISLWLNEDMQNLLKSPPNEWNQHTNEYLHLSQSINNVLGWRQGIAGLFVITSDGGIIHEFTSSAIKTDFPYVQTPFYQKAQHYYDAFLTGPEPQSYVNGTPVFSVTRALFSGPYRTWSGIIRLDYETKVINSLFENNGSSDASFYLAIDAENRIVYHPDSRYIGQQLDSAMVQDIQKKSSHSVHYLGEQHIYAAQTSKLTGWTTIGLLPETIIHQGAAGILKPLFLIGTLSLLIVLLVAMLLSSYILKPLQKINRALNLLGKGDFSPLEPTGIPKELTILVERYNLSIRKLKQLTEDLIKKQEVELREKEAELIQLQAQINPHFLYNTLSCIDSLAEQEGQTRIRSVIGNLSDLLRASLSGRERMVPLYEELQLVHSFVHIQNERHGDRIEVNWDVPPSIHQMLIPKLTIQPLVENAYFHGVEPNLGKGIIDVEARLLDDQLRIVVRDNGVGMAPHVLEEFREFIASDGSIPRPASVQRYSGLENVIRRLLLTYEENCRVTLESSLHAGTSIQFDIKSQESAPSTPHIM